MSKANDHGHLSLAGFVFQLLGSGVEAIEVYDAPRSPDDPRNLLVLERFGQDSAVLAGNLRRNRLNQYKHTSTNAEITPSEMREILQRFLISAAKMNESIDKIDFVLTTNRKWSHEAEKLWVARGDASLSAKQRQQKVERRLRLRVRKKLRCVREMASVFLRLDLRKRDFADYEATFKSEASQFGVLPDEIWQRIDAILALLFRRASASGRRSLHPAEFFEALTGIARPFRLLSESSRQTRLDVITRFRTLETEGRATQPRPMVDGIASATVSFPLVVVIGDGGSGKSVAMLDAAEYLCRDPKLAPGFVLLTEAVRLNPIVIMDEIARWRNLPQQRDGQNLDRAIDRLAIASPGRPHLVICADGIDEKAGRETLPIGSDKFLRALIANAIEQFRSSGSWEVGVVVTCRQLSDLDDLGLGAYLNSGETYKVVSIGEFSNAEIGDLAEDLAHETVRERITLHTGLQHDPTATSPRLGAQPVSSIAFRLIRHPVLWGAFTELTHEDQHQFLGGDAGGFACLAEEYLQWFRRKVAMRIPQLEKNAYIEALKSAGNCLPR